MTAAEAFAAGYGGIAAVAIATGVAPSVIGRGLKELAQDEPSERIRRPGAGRKRTIAKDQTLLPDLEALVEPTTCGDPESSLRLTCKSLRHLAQTLQAQGHEVSRTLVAHLLSEMVLQVRIRLARPARKGRNPATGEKIQIKASKASKKVAFRVAKGLSEAI